MKRIAQLIAGLFGYALIDRRTAEYLSCISGQIPWGNQVRRASACYELGEALRRVRGASDALECFRDPSWEIFLKKK